MLLTEISSIHNYQTARTAWENVGPRQTHYLAYQVSGRYDHTVNGKVYSVARDHLFFINQRDSYSVKCREKGFSVCVSFCADTELPTSVWDMRETPVVYNLFLRLQQIKNLRNESNYYLAFSILYEIFSIVSKTERQQSLADVPTENIELAVEYVSEHLADSGIKTAKLAELCGISEKYFRTLFKRRYGVTPTQYITDLRLHTAVKFLGYGGFTIAEIADMVGIPDVYYFSKLFKKKFGVSPSKFHDTIKTE